MCYSNPPNNVNPYNDFYLWTPETKGATTDVPTYYSTTVENLSQTWQLYPQLAGVVPTYTYSYKNYTE